MVELLVVVALILDGLENVESIHASCFMRRVRET